MARTAGNEAIIAREAVVSNGRVVWVPYLSGNAIRHRAVREPGFRWLLDTYGLSGKLSLQQLNFGLHGGNRLKGSSGGREDLGLIASMHRLFPLLRLVGGSLPDQIVGGCLLAGRGTLICRENSHVLTSLLPDGWVIPEGLFSFEHFITDYTYTRGDAAVTHPDMAPTVLEQPDSQLMIFSGQAVSRGAVFLQRFVINNASRLELGALLWSLRLWQNKGCTLGGQSSRGHGLFQISVLCDDADIDGAIQEYLEHSQRVADEAKAWLQQAFSAGPKSRTKKERNESPTEVNSTDSVA
jgi:hypothetical protein